MAAEDADDGRQGGSKAHEAEQLRELKRRNRLLEQDNDVHVRAAAYLSHGMNPKMMFPLVRDFAASTALLRVLVTATCRVLGY